MGYLFEELVRKFNEQANEEAGDHFTPREVIRLMVQLLFTGEDEVFKPGIYRSVYDPTAGTGGMLSESEKFMSGKNPDAHIELFGQEYNPESYAICCADLLIKDEPINNLIYGDTLGIKDAKNKTNGFVPHDGHPDKKFHYMLANPPFGVEWKPEEDFVRQEYLNTGFSGRFGAGLPRINDGSLLFLQHMMAKMHQPPKLVHGKSVGDNKGGDGSKIAIVFNGSPLFTGDAGSGESNIRRWIIERDMLDAVVALPDQMFYNTGIYTYVWIVTNKKPAHRRGQVQLIDGTRHFKKMDKSLGNKRNELSDEHIKELVRLYAEHQQDGKSAVLVDGKPEPRVCSKLFANQDFGFLKITVERPLRLNFQVSSERIARLDAQSAFANLASSKKRKDDAAYRAEVAAGEAQQAAIKAALQSVEGNTLYRNRDVFERLLSDTLQDAGIKPAAPLKKAILAALAERDPEADICRDAKGKPEPEPDPDLRDTEIVPLPAGTALPLPLGYDNETGHDKLLALVKPHCEAYLKAEVLPHVKDAWIDHSKTKIGYEIPLTRHFYVYQPPRPLEVIAAEISQLEKDILAMLSEVV
jgi:type I restriction enzyme M protein